MTLADHLARLADAEAEYEAAVRTVRSLARTIAVGNATCDSRGAIYYARGYRATHPCDRQTLAGWWRAKRELRIERECLAAALVEMPAAGKG
jgi:hypothetical protein